MNVTIIATAADSWEPDTVVALVSREPQGQVAGTISKSLRQLGLRVEVVGITERLLGGAISILDLERKPFLQDISPEDFAQLSSLLSGSSQAGMLWLTKPCQINCTDPQYSGIIGLLRVVRHETGMPLCSLELDDTTSPDAWRAVLNVYQKMRRTHSQGQADLTDPDGEFALSRGSICLPRFHWTSISNELTACPPSQATCKRLEIGKRGSLKSLKWVERPLIHDLVGDELYVDVRAVGMNESVSRAYLGESS
ncbi:hypothetical protein GGR56DRAFT_660445 [Xylariaceae sp. FL0804]|nr:hypothetical protein GGR56DRAFT_660445 [Xylariaceae sp. FL0804]